MKIILKKEVANLGEAGEVVNVKTGYALNYLVPQGFATIATPSALKQLAYPIQHKTSGFYYLIEFKAEPSFVATLETQYHRDERIIRFITVTLDQHAVAYAEHRRQNRASKKAAPAPVKEEAPVAEEADAVVEVEELNED